MDEIRHSGMVTGIRPDSVFVTIVQQTACTGCHAADFCLTSDRKVKEIEVSPSGKNLAVGQPVTVILRQQAGIKALLFGYILPFVVLLGTLFTVASFTGNEILAGFVALIMMIPYYAILYLFRGRLKKTFRFELEEQ